jgi:hypothetical protein
MTDAASSYITGDVVVSQGDFVGRDKIIQNIYQPVLRAPLREGFAGLIADRTRLFAGREPAIERIDAFLQQPRAGCLLITAPPGFGKTALMASLIQSNPNAFVYHFFAPSHHPDSLMQGFFARNLVEQMSEWYGSVDPPPPESNLSELRALYSEYLHRPSARRRVIILDALDEVTAWDLAPYLSHPLDNGLKLVLTVRDVQQDYFGLYRLPRSQTERFSLDGLSHADVQSVLDQAGGVAARVAADPHLVDLLMQAVAYPGASHLGADPFYVRIMAEDLATRPLDPSELTGGHLEDLLRAQPRGLAEYLDDWYNEVLRAVGEMTGRDFLLTLVVALGPIGRRDLERLHPSLSGGFPTTPFDEILSRTRRLVFADTRDQFAFAHPRLHDHLRMRLTEQWGPLVDAYGQNLLDYCREWRVHASEYALRYLPQHLKLGGLSGELFALIDKPWLEARRALSGSDRDFLEDADLMISAAETGGENPPDDLQCFRGSLIRVVVGEHAQLHSAWSLAALTTLGGAEKALDLASMLPGSAKRAGAYFRIAQALCSRGERDAAERVFDCAQQAADVVAADSERLAVFDEAAEAALATGQQQWLLHIAYKTSVLLQSVVDEAARAQPLVRLVRNLAAARAGEHALALIERVTAPHLQCELLTNLAGIFVVSGEAVRAGRAIAGALQALERLTSRNTRAELLGLLAVTLAEAGDSDEVTRIVGGIADARARSALLERVIAAYAMRSVVQSDSAFLQTARSSFAFVLTCSGELGRASTLASSLPNETRIPALAWIAEVAGTRGWDGAAAAARQAAEAARQAVNGVANLANLESRADLLDRLAFVLSAIGDEGAGEMSRVASTYRSALSSATSSTAKVDALAAIALALANQGQAELSVDAATRAVKLAVRTRGVRAQTLAVATRALARAGHSSVAIKVAEQYLGPADCVEAFSQIGLGLHESNDDEGVTSIVREALRSVGAIADSWRRAAALAALAPALAATGNWRLAVDAAAAVGNVGDSLSEAAALGYVAVVLAERRERRSTRLARQAVARAEGGGGGDAGGGVAGGGVAGGGDDRTRAVALARAARALAIRGDRGGALDAGERAASVVERVQGDVSRMLEMLSAIAPDLVRAGCLDRVLGILARHGGGDDGDGDGENPKALAARARIQAACGRGGDALESLVEALRRARAMNHDAVFQVVETYASVLGPAGQPEQLCALYRAWAAIESWWETPDAADVEVPNA